MLAKQDLEHVLIRTAPLWEEARGKRFFITGGTGFFGCWLLESFAFANRELNLGAKATVLTRSPERFQEKASHLFADCSIELLRGDVRSFKYPEGTFEYVVHAATSSSGDLGSGLELFDTIVGGTRRVLDFARDHGATKLLFTSSGAVYGTQPPELEYVDEAYGCAPEIAPTPLGIYAEGKRAAELLCHLYSQSFALQCKIARCFAFVGPHLPLDAHFAIGNFIRDHLKGEPIVVGGDGTPYRSYMYASDLAVWLWTILFKGASCRPYNVGSEQVVSIAELAKTVSETLTPKTEVRVVGTPNPEVKPSRYVPSTARARQELGLRCDVQLDDAIRRTARWHRGIAAAN